MTTIEVKTQKQLDAALAKAGSYDLIAILGDGYFEISKRPASDSASVTAYGSASVRASGSASVTASDSASVRASGSASVRASKYVSVHTHAGQGKPKITGGVLIEVPAITTVEVWCDLHGIELVDGPKVMGKAKGKAITVFKAVDDDYATGYSRQKGLFYRPGTDEVVAPDWDPAPQCGGGLHLAPTPQHALDYNREATRFVSMRVLVADIRKPRADDDHGKVKAKRVLGPIVEVDVHGEPVAVAEAVAS